VVDDEPGVLELVEFNLRKAGFDVPLAEYGEAALRRIEAEQPDAVVLDLMLPGVDGLEVCKLDRRDPATANLPVLMLTAKATEVDRVLGLELGAQDYLTKPFSPRELVLRVKNLLQRSQPDQVHSLTPFSFISPRNSASCLRATPPASNSPPRPPHPRRRDGGCESSRGRGESRG